MGVKCGPVCQGNSSETLCQGSVLGAGHIGILCLLLYSKIPDSQKESRLDHITDSKPQFWERENAPKSKFPNACPAAPLQAGPSQNSRSDLPSTGPNKIMP